MSNQENEILEAIEMFDYDNATEEEKKEFINLLRSVNLKKPVNKTTTNINKPVVEGFTNRELGINGNKKQQQQEEVSTEFSGTGEDAPNSFVKNRQQNNVTVAEGDQPVQIQKYVNESGLNIKQGYLNPILRQEQKKIITIDSAYRRQGTYKKEVIVSKDASGNCITDISENYILPENPGHFLINLEEPLDNVISLKVKSYEIPSSWYNISPQNGNDFFLMRFRGLCGCEVFPPVPGCEYCDFPDPSATFPGETTAFEGNWWPIIIPPGNYQPYTVNPVTQSIVGFPIVKQSGIPAVPISAYDATIAPTIQRVIRNVFTQPAPRTLYPRKNEIGEIFVLYDINTNKITITRKYDASGEEQSEMEQENGLLNFDLLFFNENDTEIGFCENKTDFYLTYKDMLGTRSSIMDKINGGGLPGGGVSPSLRNSDTTIKMGRPSTTKNNNLGYLLGFRKPYYTGSDEYTGEAPVDLNAIRYLYIVLNDFNSNFTNKIFLQSFDVDENIISTLPSYYNKNLYATEVSGNSVFVKDTNLQEECPKFPVEQQRPDACVEKILDAPKLTQAQKYSVEQILSNQIVNKETPQIANNQSNSNTICRISNNSNNFLPSLSNQITPLIENVTNPIVRNYFGPVKIKRFEVSLVNDKGNIIDMNLVDWSCSIEVTQLYQF